MLAVGGAARECRAGLGKREDRIDFRAQVALSTSRATSVSCSRGGLDHKVVGAGRLLDNRDNSTGAARGVRQLFPSSGIEQQIAGLAAATLPLLGFVRVARLNGRHRRLRP
jgi:hypothetical protein